MPSDLDKREGGSRTGADAAAEPPSAPDPAPAFGPAGEGPVDQHPSFEELMDRDIELANRKVARDVRRAEVERAAAELDPPRAPTIQRVVRAALVLLLFLGIGWIILHATSLIPGM